MSEQKIGSWEAISLITIVIVNHIILDLPKTIIQTTSTSCILNVIFISIVMLGIIYLVCKLFHNFPGLDILDISKFLGGKWLKVTMSILFLLYILFTISTLLRSFAEGLKIIFFPRTPIAIFMLLFLIAIVITNKLGFTSIARSNIFFIPLVLLNLVFIFIANWDNFVFERIFPILGYGTSATFFSGLSNLFSFGGITYLYLIPPYLKSEKNFKKVAFISIGTSAFCLLLSVATLIFLSPPVIITQQIFPTYFASQFIEFGRFFQRVDALFLLIWLFSIISYLSISFHFITDIFRKLTNLKTSKWCISVFAMFSFGIALLPQNMKELSFLQDTVYKYVVLILIFIICLSVLVFANIKHLRIQKKKGVVIKNENIL